MVARLNRGLDIGGQSIGAPTRFHIGVGVNPFAPNPDAEWRRLEHKVEAGAEFIVTPPVLDLDGVRRRAAAAARRPGCRSSRASPRSRACGTPSFSRAKSSACTIGDALLDRLRRAADPARRGARA